jgi:3-phosphoshikimate 1-carboxyvinyltransferase
LWRAGGVVRLPGSKSISNRTLLLAALAEGVSDVRNLLASDDVDRMLEALQQLGVTFERRGPQHLNVRGCGGSLPVKSASLFLGNAGTAFRPLTAVLALNGGRYKLSGTSRMHERPIGDLVDALRALGADIRYLGADGFPPLAIFPGAIRVGARVAVRGGVSSQFLTALLLALPIAGQAVSIDVEGELISKPYVDITLKLMAGFGVSVQRDGWKSFALSARQRYRSPGLVQVEGDASSASYFLAAGAIGGGPVRVEGVGRDSVQGDVRFADALAGMGAVVDAGSDWIEASAPADGKLKAFDLDLNHIPDAAMTLAVTALFADGPCRLRNIGSWRVKETDRLSAMAAELRKVGAQAEEGADYLVVTPPRALTPHAVIDTYDDHRMAMCFSLVALGGVPVRINDPSCVAKTFPDYFDRFGAITTPSSVPVIAIDGPSASGKGTVARQVAEQLGFRLLDSGALYRLVALAAARHGVDLADDEALGAAARALDCEFRDDGGVALRGQDVTLAIRTEAISSAASRAAAVPAVREALLDRQRGFRQAPGLVAEGRDMGSVVFPDATLKVFLTASPEARAQRRHKQLMEKGIHANLDALLLDINQRDARDAARSVAPLLRCADAHLIDTTGLSVEETVQQVLLLCRQALRQAPSR